MRKSTLVLLMATVFLMGGAVLFAFDGSPPFDVQGLVQQAFQRNLNSLNAATNYATPRTTTNVGSSTLATPAARFLAAAPMATPSTLRISTPMQAQFAVMGENLLDSKQVRNRRGVQIVALPSAHWRIAGADRTVITTGGQQSPWLGSYVTNHATAAITVENGALATKRPEFHRRV